MVRHLSGFTNGNEPRQRPGLYNLPIMPRWLIAVLTLHILLGLGASAFGKTPTAPLSAQASARSIQTALMHQHTTAPQAQQTATADQASTDGYECSLADTNPDLPDDQSIGLFDAGAGHAPCHCPMAMTTALSSPWLKKQPKRPRAGRMLHRA
ncbi:hypothetical protein HF896_13410 [Alicycliphilus denitrificans]|uniref:DUF2946 domain-containing protein n=1 Tax=Alicycliphilus denitrificans TaxID=179636 RepID=A0A858ZVT9_9BURK|nr:hypothetical protein [Alicycliphilus denitrificans]QKD44561.1 hypothetical protein HF896_13410 [Alicycliphilus denitrificans]